MPQGSAGSVKRDERLVAGLRRIGSTVLPELSRISLSGLGCFE